MTGDVWNTAWTILPLIIVGIIAVFVVIRMKQKAKKGTLGRKKTKEAQTMLDSLIPLGMIAGVTVSIFIGIFFPGFFLSNIGLGAGIGLLGGYIAYEMYSRKRES
jgi:mannose/fructose/N-acetylgalactosamine-specific phosphotransferase system component IID